MWTRPVVWAFAVLLPFLACQGEEDLSDINDEWIEQEERLRERIQELEGRHSELRQRLSRVEAAELDDPEQIGVRNRVQETLSGHEQGLQDARRRLQENSENREEVLREGRRGAFEAAWNAARSDFAAVEARLDELSSQHQSIEDGLTELEEALAPEGQSTKPRPEV